MVEGLVWNEGVVGRIWAWAWRCKKGVVLTVKQVVSVTCVVLNVKQVVPKMKLQQYHQLLDQGAQYQMTYLEPKWLRINIICNYVVWILVYYIYMLYVLYVIYMYG